MLIENLICIIGLLSLCGFGGVALIVSLIVAGFKTKPEGEENGEVNLKQQKKIE